MYTELITNLLTYVFYFSVIIQLFYFIFFYCRIIFWKKPNKTKQNNLPEITIIIAAKNEADNLKKNLPHFLNQNYPKYTVIVVNDASIDNTKNILEQLSEKHKNLYVTTIPHDKIFKHGKKTALTIGIKAAKTELLLFSDADCRPASKNWITQIVENFDAKTDFVIGFGAYENKKGWLNKIIRSDTVYIGMQYLSFAMAKIPYMAVGRNMAYKKSMFMNKKGFANQMKLISGSDDLFVNQNATKNNLKATIEPQSFTYSETKPTFKKWAQQKTRHLTTGKFYKFKHRLLLGLKMAAKTTTITIGIILLIMGKQTIFVAATLFLRYFLFAVIMQQTNKKFNQKGLLFTELILDIFLPLINFILYITARKKKEFIWK